MKPKPIKFVRMVWEVYMPEPRGTITLYPYLFDSWDDAMACCEREKGEDVREVEVMKVIK